MSELSNTQLYPVPPMLHSNSGTEKWPMTVTATDVEALLDASDKESVWQDVLTRNWPLVMLLAPSLLLAAIVGWVSRP